MLYGNMMPDAVVACQVHFLYCYLIFIPGPPKTDDAALAIRRVQGRLSSFLSRPLIKKVVLATITLLSLLQLVSCFVAVLLQAALGTATTTGKQDDKGDGRHGRHFFEIWSAASTAANALIGEQTASAD